MNDSDRQAFAAIMTGVAENFGQTVTPVGISLRFEALKAHGIDAITRAAMSILAQRKYTTMPTVADFLEHLGGGTAEDRAEVAAAKVWKAIETVGAYRSVVFDDPVAQAVVENCFGGWVRLCTETKDCDQNFWRKDFAKAYGAYSRQGVISSGALPGLVALNNERKGLEEGLPPVLIGDAEKAQEVLEAGKEREAAVAIAGDFPFALPYGRGYGLDL